ncbi:MAG: Glutathione transport system permease protein GsiC [Herbaspirillum frisingense]|uniref:Glutathione transport system permease protein GsiC n=1 Tax=Herbaspirillum frisingense TaxID=92645 RepID=A0A7V8FVW1_9BURK|nr:MAG: Glutathione transport system permease protein GsiC [Herbaspirillum frisingense]
MRPLSNAAPWRRLGTALAQRLLQACLVALLVGTLCFFMTRMLPGDMAYRIAAGRYGYDMVSAAAAEAVRQELGLDRPWPLALGEWWSRLLHLDLGVSQVTAQPVLAEIVHQLGPTVRLSLLAMAFSLLIGPTAGVLAGLNPGGALDRATLAMSVALRALPSFLLGLILVLIFSVQLGALPAAGHGDHGGIMLPALTLALGLAAVSCRVARDAMVQVRQSAYFAFALTKGLTPHQALTRHGLRNVAAPVTAYLGVQLVALVEGVVLVETIFAWPGIGHALVHAIFGRDVPMIQGSALVLGLMFVLFNALVDAACAFIDPRGRP